MQSARAGFPAGAIPTVDFLLAHPATIVKKMGVKTLVRVGSRISNAAEQAARPADCLCLFGQIATTEGIEIQ
ncbi:MAG TPA: hypothetical protein VH249_07225 [Xanthobacteraceae bacterium]|jgi:hypothetical protein|nr:hypothetical protein [Xanthobacteraceae bacterium]